MEAKFISISRFCQLLWVSRQYFYLKKEEIERLAEIQYKFTLWTLNRKNLLDIREFFEENTRVKIIHIDDIRFTKYKKEFTLKEWLQIIWLTHPTLLAWIDNDWFQKLDLPFSKKVNKLSEDSVSIVKKELVNK